jgi:hypothetical protein
LKSSWCIAVAAWFIAIAPAAAGAEPVLPEGSLLKAVERLKAGEYFWAPEIAPGSD